MLDFMMVSTKSTKSGTIEIYPKFIIKKSQDLMIRGGDFYAVWNEDKGLWSTDEGDVIFSIDRELDKFFEKNKNKFGSNVRILHMWDAETGVIDHWHKYCQKQMRDNYTPLDEEIMFSNSDIKKESYASKKLSYPLKKSSYKNYDKLIGTLYSEEERHKLEWAIGAIVTGESKYIQKFVVLYGDPGSGKSTILNIIQDLFEGYYSVFDARALGSSSNVFALEAFKTNPLVAIQHDGDLSRLEDNTRLNSLVSHEMMTVNEKFKSTYSTRFKSFLFMGTNKPVRISDGKSGLIRRLIDVSPSGNKLSHSEYDRVVSNIKFELSGIAYHCKQVYEANPSYYDKYVPINMLGASNDFYNFILDSFYIFSKENSTTLKSAWEMYKNYCSDANVPYPMSMRNFKEELKNYFETFNERDVKDGTRVRNCYNGFKKDIFVEHRGEINTSDEYRIEFKDDIESIFDKTFGESLAQIAKEDETPKYKWDNVTTKLKDIDTSKLHYVKLPINHIVIDFDIPDENGKKSFEKNLEAASKFPKTYAELSKSGAGIHLHYNYTGDVSKLSRVYDDHIEIKVFNGNSSLRRKLTKCNDLPILEISSGLPLKKEGKKMIDKDIIKNEKMLRNLISKNLNKEIHPGTKPSIDFIFKLLEDAYNSGISYDVSDMKKDIYVFAANSTHQSQYCIKLVGEMKFQSKDKSEGLKESEKDILVFFDIEIFPNLFLVNWKKRGKGQQMVRLINPSPKDIEELIQFKLIGFNNRRYDNHMLYACLMGYSVEELYKLSERIISGDRTAMFGEAYNISYTDVYDFASAVHKQSLKKFEIELGIKHHELGLPWDEPVPEKDWVKVAEYCDDDVLATEATFDYLENDWIGRKILAKMAGKTVNDSTNSLCTAIVFGKNKNPQDEFNYRDLSKPVGYPEEVMDTDEADWFDDCDEVPFDTVNKPMYDFLKNNKLLDLKFTAYNGEKSILPFFPGYQYKNGKSTYRGIEVGEGGYVEAQHGIHHNVALLDVASMHPTSTIAECLFGPKYTSRYKDIKDSRVAIKHNDEEAMKTLLDGMLWDVLQEGDFSTKALSTALKTPINSTYGLTSASFINPFRDIRNKDNIVAKRGALFMVDLKYEVEKRGFTVAHIKTDSIKIPDATPEIIQFVMDFGKKYGYTFEHEATYKKMCLVNNAVYIAKFMEPEECIERYGYAPEECVEAYEKNKPWTATGTQFAVPYVFKTLFSHEPIEFKDMCEVKSVTSLMYLNMNLDIPLEELDKSKLHFIGKVGNFCPVSKEVGGILLREQKDKKTGNIKYMAVTGTKGYYWLESEMVEELGLKDDIDKSYYQKLVDDAVGAIGTYGDFEQFIS